MKPTGAFARVALCAAAVALVVAVFRKVLPANPVTVALILLLLVLAIAAVWRLRYAVFTAFLAAACFNFFFLPPYGTFAIADPHNWVAFFVFLVVAVVASQLAERARRSADMAEQRHREVLAAVEQLGRAEAARQSEQLRTALLDSLTHELRTPLTAIKASVTGLMSDRNLSADDRGDLLAVINEETERLNRLVGQVTEMAALEASAVELRLEPRPMRDVIDGALDECGACLRNHRVEVRVPPELPLARMDGERIQEVLRLLVENAAKYSPAGSPILITSQQQDGRVVTSVADRGAGIPAAELGLVFDKFYRGREQREHSQGSGMGLAIAKAIVEAHKGSIAAASQPGHGSVFSFTLPL